MTRTGGPWPDGPTLSDEAIDALVEGRATDPDLARLATFARQVQLAGEEPPPEPSPELAALLCGELTLPPVAVPVATPAPTAAPGLGRRGWHRVAAGWAWTAGTVAGLGLAAKIGLGTAVAAAGVVGASAAGVLPDPVDDAVRDAVDAVTPFKLGDDETPADEPGDGGGVDRGPEGRRDDPGTSIPAGSSTTGPIGGDEGPGQTTVEPPRDLDVPGATVPPPEDRDQDVPVTTVPPPGDPQVTSEPAPPVTATPERTGPPASRPAPPHGPPPATPPPTSRRPTAPPPATAHVPTAGPPESGSDL